MAGTGAANRVSVLAQIKKQIREDLLSGVACEQIQAT